MRRTIAGRAGKLSYQGQLGQCRVYLATGNPHVNRRRQAVPHGGDDGDNHKHLRKDVGGRESAEVFAHGGGDDRHKIQRLNRETNKPFLDSRDGLMFAAAVPAFYFGGGGGNFLAMRSGLDVCASRGESGRFAQHDSLRSWGGGQVRLDCLQDAQIGSHRFRGLVTAEQEAAVAFRVRFWHGRIPFLPSAPCLSTTLWELHHSRWLINFTWSRLSEMPPRRS